MTSNIDQELSHTQLPAEMAQFTIDPEFYTDKETTKGDLKLFQTAVTRKDIDAVHTSLARIFNCEASIDKIIQYLTKWYFQNVNIECTWFLPYMYEYFIHYERHKKHMADKVANVSWCNDQVTRNFMFMLCTLVCHYENTPLPKPTSTFIPNEFSSKSTDDRARQYMDEDDDQALAAPLSEMISLLENYESRKTHPETEKRICYLISWICQYEIKMRTPVFQAGQCVSRSLSACNIPDKETTDSIWLICQIILELASTLAPDQLTWVSLLIRMFAYRYTKSKKKARIQMIFMIIRLLLDSIEGALDDSMFVPHRDVFRSISTASIMCNVRISSARDLIAAEYQSNNAL